MSFQAVIAGFRFPLMETRNYKPDMLFLKHKTPWVNIRAAIVDEYEAYLHFAERSHFKGS